MANKKERNLQEIMNCVGKTYVRSDDHKDFGEIFSAAAESQTCIQKSINNLILSALTHDVSSRVELKKIIREVEKEDFHSMLKKGFGVIIWLSALVAGSVVTIFIQFLGKKLLGP